ncbi:hypothetical protein KJ612_08625 [Myxococcota bacterium]|jgi:hypothetical protein|nr:hypothetical protein [Myxococcota bacterium]PKN25584.1 MAG: hypothetical protein CVU65_08375 [Deltaproteobacteria bacterium HGW-Deltaproteobacteria-22]
MSNIRHSYYSRREKVQAALEMIRRMKEKWADDPVMLHLIGELEPLVLRLAESYQGVDTRPATLEVQEADEARDRAGRAFFFHLKGIAYSAGPDEVLEAAGRLLHLLAADGLGWLHDSYTLQSQKTRELLDGLGELEADVEKCRARAFVDQIAITQADFEKKLTERGAVAAEKPEPVTAAAPEFERALTATLLMIERRPADTARAYVLEPFSRLNRRYRGGSTGQTPTPGA